MKMHLSYRGMEALVTALKGILNFETFITYLTDLIPVIGGVLIFAFTYRIIRKLIKGASKAKANI